MKYVLKEKKLNSVTYEENIDNGFEIKSSVKDFEIKKLVIYDDEMKDYCINQKFLNRFKKILKVVLEVIDEDDATDTDVELLIGEIDRLEAIILGEYKKHIKLEKVKKMLKELYILKQELKKKQELLYVYSNLTNKSR